MADGSNALDSLFHPRTVTVIGASSDLSKLGGRTFRTLKQ